MTYTEKVLADLKAKNPDQPEFIQSKPPSANCRASVELSEKLSLQPNV